MRNPKSTAMRHSQIVNVAKYALSRNVFSPLFTQVWKLLPGYFFYFCWVYKHRFHYNNYFFLIILYRLRLRQNIIVITFKYNIWYDGYVGILCKINLAIVFVCVRSTISVSHCQFIALRFKSRSPEKDFQAKNEKWSIAAFVLTWRQFLRQAYVKKIFDHMPQPKP